jgi:methyl-accepting chemotaxis protein
VHRIERANRLLRNSRIIILVGFGLLAIATLALIVGLFRSREADMWVVHTFQVQQTAQALLISTRDAESAVRSYLLSGDGKDLDQFEPSLTDAGSQLKALAELTSDNAVQQNRVQILGTLIQSKDEQLKKCVGLAKSGQRDAALAVINSRDDRQTLAKIRAGIEEVLDSHDSGRRLGDLHADRRARPPRTHGRA